jgi:hypothetical protein
VTHQQNIPVTARSPTSAFIAPVIQTTAIYATPASKVAGIVKANVRAAFMNLVKKKTLFPAKTARKNIAFTAMAHVNVVGGAYNVLERQDLLRTDAMLSRPQQLQWRLV